MGRSAETGAIIGGAPEDAISALRGYGDDLGLAFQIMDDVLDLTGGSDKSGKPAGQYALDPTITLPVIYYLRMVEQHSPEWRDVQAIVDGSRQDDEFVAGVLESIRASGAVEQAVDCANDYIEQANGRLDVVPDAETRDLLIELAESSVPPGFLVRIVQRESKSAVSNHVGSIAPPGWSRTCGKSRFQAGIGGVDRAQVRLELGRHFRCKQNSRLPRRIPLLDRAIEKCRFMRLPGSQVGYHQQLGRSASVQHAR